MFACFPGLLGGKAHEEPATVTAAETIQRLRGHIENQEKRETFVDRKIKGLAQEAREKLASGDKKTALTMLKKRKMYETELTRISNMKMTLETQCMQLESAAGTAEAFQAMSNGTSTMQKIRHNMGGVDAVDDTMMDMQEEMQMNDEVNQAIGQAMDPMMGLNMNEDDLLKELDAMENETLNDKFDLAEGHKTSYLKPLKGKSKKQSEANDLKKLEAELAGL